MTNEPTEHEKVDELLEEHRVIRGMLSEVCRVLAQRGETVGQISQRIDAVRDFLTGHFRQEEDGGFFQKVQAQAPWLSDRTQLLEREHATLLEAVSGLADRARGGDGQPPWWHQLETEFVEFSKRLISHETWEHELLQQAYGEDIGSHD